MNNRNFQSLIVFGEGPYHKESLTTAVIVDRLEAVQSTLDTPHLYLEPAQQFCGGQSTVTPVTPRRASLLTEKMKRNGYRRPELRSERATREHKIIKSLGNWDESTLLTLRCPPDSPRTIDWVKEKFRSCVIAVERLTGKPIHFFLVVNRGKSGMNRLASGHVLFESPVSDELVSMIRAEWAHFGKTKKTTAGGAATKYVAINCSQPDAETVHWQSPVWDNLEPLQPDEEMDDDDQWSDVEQLEPGSRAALEADWFSENWISPVERYAKRQQTLADLFASAKKNRDPVK